MLIIGVYFWTRLQWKSQAKSGRKRFGKNSVRRGSLRITDENVTVEETREMKKKPSSVHQDSKDAVRSPQKPARCPRPSPRLKAAKA